MSDFSSRMTAQVTIEFDTGSEYGGKWTFEDAYKDALREVEGQCGEIRRAFPGVKIVKIDSVRSHVIERKRS